MGNNNIKDKIIEIAIRHFGLEGAASEELHEGTRLAEDLGADSLDVIEIVLTIEDEFEIEIPDTAFGYYTEKNLPKITIGSMVKTVKSIKKVSHEKTA